MQPIKVRSKMENWKGHLYRRGKQFLPHLARLFLVSPFLENGVRMFQESAAQQDYIDRTWLCGRELAFLYVFICILSQPIGALMILARIRVKWACFFLSFNLLLQTLAESLTWDTTYLLRAASLAGSVMLLLVDGFSKDRSVYAGGLHVLAKGQGVSYTQFSGPLLVLFMMAALPGTSSFSLIALQNLIGTLMWICAPGGNRLKFGSLALALTGFAIVLYSQESWRTPSEDTDVDFSKYNIFPSICATGGLLMIICLGFGDASIHERRKRLAKTFTGSQTDLRENLSNGNEVRGLKGSSLNCTRRRSF